MLLASIMALAALQQADALRCTHVDGFIDGPVVPDARTARAIYAVVLARYDPKGRLRTYKVGVEDAPEHWRVTNTPPAPHARDGEILVRGVDAGLSMQIDKCTGAVTQVHYIR